MVVMRQAVVDQHRLAVLAEHDAGRLDVVMHDVLPVQIGKRGRDLADRGRAPPRRQAAGPAGACKASVRGCARSRHRPGGRNRRWQTRPAHAAPEGAAGSSAPSRRRRSRRDPRLRATRGIFMSSGTSISGWRDAPQRRHAAMMDAFADRKTVEHRAGLDQGMDHPLTFPATADRRARAADRRRECAWPRPRHRSRRGNR